MRLRAANFDPERQPGNYFVRFFFVDPAEEGPDEEYIEELCNDGEEISLPEAVARAKTLEPRWADADRWEVVHRCNVHWDFGWEWRDRVDWEAGEDVPSVTTASQSGGQK